MDTIDTIERDNCTIEIYVEDYPMNSREWDNLGTMVCWHSRYNLGDKNDFNDPEDFYEWLKDNKSVVLPLYLYDHSGITMSTSNSRYPFTCPWDSGQVGYIYVTYEQIREEYGYKLITQKRYEQIAGYLRNEITEYDNYLTGNVYWFNVFCDICDPDHEELIDSCGGFNGYNWKENGLMDQADTECPDCKQRVKSGYLQSGPNIRVERTK